MAKNELHCKEHGPYDARYGRCPVCYPSADKLPKPPASLYNDDDETTPPGPQAKRNIGKADWQSDATVPPGKGEKAMYEDSGTVPPIDKGRRNKGGPDGTYIPSKEDKGPLGWFIVKRSNCFKRGKILEFRSEAIYGREPSTTKEIVLIDDEQVSALHFKIRLTDGKFYITDLDSSNGTLVNGEKISSTTELKQDDQIQIGETIFVLKTLLE